MKNKRHGELTMGIQVILLVFAGILLLLFKSHMTGSVIYDYQPDSIQGVDSFMYENSSSNFGSNTLIDVGKIANGRERRGLLYFDVSSIPPTDTVVSAFLSLYLMGFSNNSGYGNLTINAYKLTSSWNESNVNWYNTSAGVLWSVAGGDYSSLISSTNISNALGWYNFSITSAVRGWANGSSSNYGIILIASGASAGDFQEFYSSDYGTSSLRPRIIVDYTGNAPPTLESMNVSSSAENPKFIGQNVSFTVNWSDLESDSIKLFVCNSSSISTVGCAETTFCSTSYSIVNPVSCNYTTVYSNNKTTSFWVAVCDAGNCSSSTVGSFYVNHLANISLVQPNGGQTINQTQGNYSIKFNVSDVDNDNLFGNIYYGLYQNSTSYPVASSLNLSSICTDLDHSFATTNNCSYSWNTTGIFGNYYLTIIVNDTFSISNDSSDSSFNVISLIDDVAPIIDGSWKSEGTIYSGKVIQFNVNITESNMGTAWVSINTSSQQNVSMTNISGITYMANFTAPAVGNYQWIVYVRDLTGNLNSTSASQFEVIKPVAVVNNVIVPSQGQPYSAVRVSSQLNASDNLKSVTGYINLPDGFTVMEGYLQNKSLGNFSQNETKTANWMVSCPLDELNYTINVTYIDYYGNEWNSSNAYIKISSTATSTNTSPVYSLELQGYSYVSRGENYSANAYFARNGEYVQPDNVLITMTDPVGSKLSDHPTSMSNLSTGIFNYTRKIDTTWLEGQWETLINASMSGVSYYAHQYWRVVGTLFDVRDIVVVNASTENLFVTYVLENKGTKAEDMFVYYNLTKESTGEVLGSWFQTIGVDPKQSKSANVTGNSNPSSGLNTRGYVGEVKLTILGVYGGGGAKAGAYQIFNLVAQGNQSNQTGGGEQPSGGGNSGGGGGGGGMSSTNTSIKLSPVEGGLEIEYDDVIYVSRNMIKNFTVVVKNKKGIDLNNIVLSIEGLSTDYYRIFPSSLNSLKNGDEFAFIVQFFVKDITGEQPFSYTLKAGNESYKKSAVLMVLSVKDFLEREFARLKSRFYEINSSLDSNQNVQVVECANLIDLINNNLNNEDYLVASGNVEVLNNCLNKIEKSVTSKPRINLTGIVKNWGILILAFLVLVLLAWGVWILYKKLTLLGFVKGNLANSSGESSNKPKHNIDENMFDDKISNIKKRLE
ncbi:MAG: DNRLRE domain-containing protein [Nanoarchaeota archaeon]